MDDNAMKMDPVETLPVGVPELLEAREGDEPLVCPRCGLIGVPLVKGNVSIEGMKSPVSFGVWAGCPACGWMSRAMYSAQPCVTKQDRIKNINEALTVFGKVRDRLLKLLDKEMSKPDG